MVDYNIHCLNDFEYIVGDGMIDWIFVGIQIVFEIIEKSGNRP
jgi:hypothetical protein